MSESETKKQKVPLLPLKDIVVFPHMIAPLFVGRKCSVNALEAIMSAQSQDQKALLVPQKDSNLEDPTLKDLQRIGTLVNIVQLLKLPDGTVKVLVEGEARFQVTSVAIIGPTNKEYFEATGMIVESSTQHTKSSFIELEALKNLVGEHFEDYIKLNKKIPPEVFYVVNQIADYSKFVDTVASYFSLKLEQKQELLETVNIKKRLEKLVKFMNRELDVLKVQQRIHTRVKSQMEKSQREYYLNEQIKALHLELHANGEGVDEIADFEAQIKQKTLPAEVKRKAQSEVRKLRMMSHASAEAVVARNYLDWILGLPWASTKLPKIDLEKAQAILDENHYGLEKVKERIIEFLAVQSRVRKVQGPILCLVGPPGVGKTSLGKSVAKATGREFYRMSLGGVRDEAEIRGHRRTYIGSMPGKIIQGMRKARTTNPMILLDEIDKIGKDWRGDPASALLEVLDPEQNANFNDHYLELDYDLSHALFITTANTLNMPPPLLDRLEIIRLSGYTEDEKMHIAKRYLIPKQMTMHGLKETEIIFTEEAVVQIIRYYTREAGVRNLEREIAKICRKAVRRLVNATALSQIEITVDVVHQYAGVPRFAFGTKHEQPEIGVVNGLAWTEAGGELLKIEALILPGSGKTLLTGKLGDVMQESIQTAISLVRSRFTQLKVKDDLMKNSDIHVHVPEGSIPKDGPSAGIGMFVAIASALTQKPVNKDIAMTGEVTLTGHVLAIGGLKEKLLAAHRAGIKRVIIPMDNQKDLEEVPKNICEELDIIAIKLAEEALPYVFEQTDTENALLSRLL